MDGWEHQYIREDTSQCESTEARTFFIQVPYLRLVLRVAITAARGCHPGANLCARPGGSPRRSQGRESPILRLPVALTHEAKSPTF